MPATTWGENLEATMSDIFDIMAHEPIKLVIEGELNAVDGTLYVQDPIDHRWTMAASAPDCETTDVCLAELIDQYQTAKRQEARDA